MNLLQDVITYIRRIIKTQSDTSITDNLLIDYINRFWLADVDARMQLFDLKTKYEFVTTPGVDRYNMPLYNIQTQPGAQEIAPFPVYQGFLSPCYINGFQMSFHTREEEFIGIYPNYAQPVNAVAQGDGTIGPYTLQIPFTPNVTTLNQLPSGLVRGHVDMTGIIASEIAPIQDPIRIAPNSAITSIQAVPVTSVFSAVYITTTDSNGYNVVVADSGQFLEDNYNCGVLMQKGDSPNGNLPLGAANQTQNIVNYQTGAIYVTFPVAIPQGQNINITCFYMNPGLPRAVLFYNNVIRILPIPSNQFVASMEAYLTPAAFLNTEKAIPFGYMAEYIARGAARKILSDTGDWEQFDRYEPLFIEQERLVWKRSQRQFTATRSPTIYGGNTGITNNYLGSWSVY